MAACQYEEKRKGDCPRQDGGGKGCRDAEVRFEALKSERLKQQYREETDYIPNPKTSPNIAVPFAFVFIVS